MIFTKIPNPFPKRRNSFLSLSGWERMLRQPELQSLETHVVSEGGLSPSPSESPLDALNRLENTLDRGLEIEGSDD